MNFDEKLISQFRDFKVGKPNISKHKYHLYSDYIEMLALFTNSCVTKSDILDRLFDEGIELHEDEDNSSDLYSDKSEKDDKNENWITEIFDLIGYRVSLFAIDYPFETNRGGIELKNNLSDKNKIYLSLLISSNLNHFKILQPELTTEFETISHQSLKNYMPANAKVKATGKNTEYSGYAKEKIKKIASEINIDTNDNELSDISDRNVQEEGLDLIAWIPFEDKIPNLITILAQCACGKDWIKKQHETGRYENFFNFYKQQPIHAMYIPYAISNNQSFYQSKDINKGRMIFDRKRILEYLSNTDFFSTLKSNTIVDKCIEYEEDIV